MQLVTHSITSCKDMKYKKYLIKYLVKYCRLRFPRTVSVKSQKRSPRVSTRGTQRMFQKYCLIIKGLRSNKHSGYGTGHVLVDLNVKRRGECDTYLNHICRDHRIIYLFTGFSLLQTHSFLFNIFLSFHLSRLSFYINIFIFPEIQDVILGEIQSFLPIPNS